MALWIGGARFRLVGASLIILLLAGTGYLLPRTAILNKDSVRADIVSQLAAWTGGTIEISGPVHLNYFPRITLTTHGFELKSSPNIPHLSSVSAREMRVELGLWSLLSRQAAFKRVVLIDPEIALNVEKPEPVSSTPAGSAPSLTGAVRVAPIPAIKIVNGDITVSGPQTNEKLTSLTARATVALPEGAVAARGNFAWRKQALDFSFSAVAPESKGKGAKTPVKLTVQSPLVSVEIEGESALGDSLRATGTLDLEVANLRGFARWLGLLVLDGPGLGAFTASGAFDLNGRRIGFNQGTFTLDDNKALGTLAVEFGGARPKIVGTLAFSTINVAEYWERAEPAPQANTQGGAEKPGPIIVDFPLLHHLDLDLRLSTSEMVATPLTLGQVAVSVAVNSGRLVADFAILDLCAGNGSGRLTFDAAVPETKIRLTGNVAGLASQTCLEAIGAEKISSGGIDLSIDLNSRGRSSVELLHHLGGKVLLEAGPGEIGLDLAPLSIETDAARISGWQPLRGGTTVFSKASAELIFRQGRVFSDSLKMISGETLYAGEGWIDMTAQSLDLKLTVGKPPAPSAAGEPSPVNAPASSLSVNGPWSKPLFTVKRAVTGSVSETVDAADAKAQ